MKTNEIEAYRDPYKKNNADDTKSNRPSFRYHGFCGTAEGSSNDVGGTVPRSETFDEGMFNYPIR